jgi:hypothetical protein
MNNFTFSVNLFHAQLTPGIVDRTITLSEEDVMQLEDIMSKM